MNYNLEPMRRGNFLLSRRPLQWQRWAVSRDLGYDMLPRGCIRLGLLDNAGLMRRDTSHLWTNLLLAGARAAAPGFTHAAQSGSAGRHARCGRRSAMTVARCLSMGVVMVLMSACNEPEPAQPLEQRASAESAVAQNKEAEEALKAAWRARVDLEIQALDGRISSLAREIAKAALASEEARPTISKIQITAERFYFFKDQLAEAVEPTIAFDLSNGTDAAIKGVYLHAVLNGRNQEQPLVEGTLYHAFIDPLDRGESRHLELAPDRLTPWGDKALHGRKDLKLSVAVIRVEDADGKTLGLISESELAPKRAQLSSLLSERRTLAQRRESP